MASPEEPEAWIALATEEQVRTVVGAQRYEALMGGVVPRMARLIMTHPLIGRALSLLSGVVNFSAGALSRAEREMVATVAASAQDCRYCAQHHAEFLRLEGGALALVEAIKAQRWREFPDLSERERALCELGEKLSATPSRMTQEDWRPLRELGFNDRACLEVAHLVGLYTYLARLASGFGLQPTEARYPE
jgi:uncharacterized peroxidase-related enzyme